MWPENCTFSIFAVSSKLYCYEFCEHFDENYFITCATLDSAGVSGRRVVWRCRRLSVRLSQVGVLLQRLNATR